MAPDGKTMALGYAGPRGANGNTAGDKIEMVSLDTRAVAATDLTGLAVAFGQDGHLALTGDTNGKVTLWNVDGGTRLADLPGLDGYIDWVAFGAGAKVAIADNHGLDRLTFWDVNSGQLLSSFEQARTFSIAVSADGERLARDTVDGSLQPSVWMKSEAARPSGHRLHDRTAQSRLQPRWKIARCRVGAERDVL